LKSLTVEPLGKNSSGCGGVLCRQPIRHLQLCDKALRELGTQRRVIQTFLDEALRGAHLSTGALHLQSIKAISVLGRTSVQPARKSLVIGGVLFVIELIHVVSPVGLKTQSETPLLSRGISFHAG
jgi:hypothetical protein